MSEEQYMRHISRYTILYATSGNTKCMPHQDIHDVRFIRKCHLCLQNNRYATLGGTIYCTPHQEIHEIRHIRKYRMKAISRNVMYVWRTIYTPNQAIQYIVRHIKKYKKYATSVNTVCCTPHHEKQEVCHIRKYGMCVIAENVMYFWRTHQEI